MKSVQVIPFTDICNYLGIIFLQPRYNVIIDNAITDINKTFNNLLATFSHCDDGTLSTVFNTYCINIMDDKREDIMTIWIDTIW